MVGASKILTVSYGTFSCTLEGFDDPFSTMKAIAEYFRDLAADDRYFGAEPPQPDAEMLHRIAEREVQRRVEARVGDNGVVLRAGALSAPTETTMAPPKVAEPVSRQPEVTAAPSAAAAATAGVAAAGVAAAGAAVATGESIAAKLQRIRAAVEQARIEAANAHVPEAETIEDADQPEDLIPVATPLGSFGARAEPAEVAQVEPEATAEEEIVSEEAVAEETVEAPAEAAEAAAEEEAADEEAAPVQPEEAAAPEEMDAHPEPEPESDDALGDRVGGVVADLAAASAEATGAEEPARPRARVIKVRRIEPEKPGGRVVIETTEAEIEAEAEGAAIGAETEAAPETAHETAAEEETAAPSSLAPEAEAELQAELADLEREMAGAAPAEVEEPAAVEFAPVEAAEADEEPSGEPLVLETPVAPEPVAEAETDSDWYAEERETAEPEAPALAATADEDEAGQGVAARAEDGEEAAEDHAGAASAGEAAHEQGAGDEEGAEPLAEVEEEPAELADLAPAAEVAPERPRLNLTQRVEADGAALDRLMKQTASVLDEPEARRRQSTLQHLKAAVAATQAEKEVTGGGVRMEAADLDRYRDDLAQVVRPRRPMAGGAATARPQIAPDRPAPLVLVSEQRVDRSPNAEPVVIRPRRVSSANLMAVAAAAEEDDEDDAENIFASSKSFAEFADRMGATDLPDLLEAAAAYAACVEGRPHFSRPQILRSAVEAASEPVTKEESLRSFGMLLRQGKITKVKRGQFAIAESSRFLPEARKIAQ